MIEMDTIELCEAINGQLIAGNHGEFKGVSIDSRKIEPGQLFFAIRGENFDGHQFVDEALKKGGVGAIVNVDCDIELRGQFLIKVDNTTKALQHLAHYYRKKFALKVVGVTGSVGKTTTKDMISAVLKKKYNVLKTEGNLNNYYGLPLTLFRIKPEHQILVAEMGMSAPGEIEFLAKLAEPEYGVITNIAHSHMEQLKTLENVAKAKEELVENLIGKRIAILNADDHRVKRMAAKAGKGIFYGIKEDADYKALEITESINLLGTDVVVSAEGKKIKFRIPLPGRHNVYNALAAISIGRTMGLTFDEIYEGLLDFKPSKMRMNILNTLRGLTILNDAYNANPASMKAAIEVLAGCNGKRKIAVIGDMLELGEYAESAHREIGRLAATKEVDLLFVTGNYRDIVTEGALEAGLTLERIFVFSTNEKAGEKLNSIVQPGDVILVKGSRGMAMEEIVEILTGKEG